jgi:hypothetical protein
LLPGGEEPDAVGLAWLASSVEAASMLCTSRASGSRAQAEMRGNDVGVASGRSRSVAQRCTSRLRPSGNATAMKLGPRAHFSDNSLRRWPYSGWRGSVMVMNGMSRSKLAADRSTRGPAMTLAAVDRLVHHSTIFELNVESYRRRMALERKQQGPGRPAFSATVRNVGAVTPRDKQPAA